MPGRPIWPVAERQRDEAAGVVGAVDVLRHAHAPEDDRRLGAGVEARDFAQRLRRDAADLGHRLRREVADVFDELLEILGVRLDVLPVVEFFLDDRVQHGIEHRHVAAGPELQHVRGVALQRLPARVHDDELRAALGRVLEEGRGDRMVLDRIGADDDDHVGVLGGHERRRHGARADAFEKTGHGRGVTQARAVVDVVGGKAGAHELLEQVGFLVRALGRAEAGERVAAVAVADALEAAGRALQRLVPGRLAEMRPRVGGIDRGVVL